MPRETIQAPSNSSLSSLSRNLICSYFKRLSADLHAFFFRHWIVTELAGMGFESVRGGALEHF
jgi:hypothetical protein